MVRCPDLPDPVDGSVELRSGTEVGSIAVYSCNEGFVLFGGFSIRQCGSDGMWSGKAPVCNTGIHQTELLDSINVIFPTEVCTVELVGDIEVTGDAAIYSFRGVGSGIKSYFCKLDGVLLPDCMCCLPSTLNNEHKLM